MLNSLGIRIKSIGGQIPKWKNMEDAGLDLHASVDMVVAPGERIVMPLGIQTEFGPQYVAIIKDRSGLAGKGICVRAGVIDSSYRGEWKVVMANCGEETWDVKRGDRVAQVIFMPCFHLTIEEVDSLSSSERGGGGFGSSGR